MPRYRILGTEALQQRKDAQKREREERYAKRVAAAAKTQVKEAAVRSSDESETAVIVSPKKKQKSSTSIRPMDSPKDTILTCSDASTAPARNAEQNKSKRRRTNSLGESSKRKKASIDDHVLIVDRPLRRLRSSLLGAPLASPPQPQQIRPPTETVMTQQKSDKKRSSPTCSIALQLTITVSTTTATAGLNDVENQHVNKRPRSIFPATQNNETKKRSVLKQTTEKANNDPFLRGIYNLNNDPFPTILRCRRFEVPEPVTESTQPTSNPSPPPSSAPRLVLNWTRLNPRYTRQQENALLHVLLCDHKIRHTLMARFPPRRIAQIRKACTKQRVPLEVALALRRLHIQRIRSLRQSPLPKRRGPPGHLTRRSAEIFERVVESYLRAQTLPFYNEDDQRQHNLACNLTRYPPTPDFVFQYPITLRTIVESSVRNSIATVDHVIHWIDAKMFYGANSLPWDDSTTAVGGLLKTAQKYVRLFGRGAFIFLYGCGKELAEQLEREGVVALDGSTGLLDLRQVYAHQRGWCSTDWGEILP